MKLKEKISISLFIIIGILALSILIFIKSQKKNIDIVNKEYFDKCISNESINFIEYTDKFSFEDTLINNIIKINSEKNIEYKKYKKLLPIIYSTLNSDLDNKELKEGNREIVLNHIYFFKVFSKKINVDISPDIKKKIHQFINEYYINNINNMKALNKFVLLDILEKLTFINESKDTRLNASILQMLEYCEKINLNIYLDKEVTSFYKLNILHNMNSKKLTIDLKYKISSIANNFLSNIDKKFIQSPENVAIINMAIVSLLKVDTKIVSKVRVEFINIIENSIDIPAILKFYYFDTLSKISKDTNIKKVIDTYPMDKDGICTSPAMLIPSFRTLYFFINIKNFDSILLNKYKSQQDIYIDQLFNKYTNKTVDLRESYYFLAMEKYLNSNSEFKNFKKNIVISIKELDYTNMDFNELYWSIKVLDILGEYNIIFTLKDKLINTYEKDKITYKKNKNFIIIQSMYQEMNYIFNKKTDNKEVLKGIKALEDNLVNYDDEFFIECTNNYLNLIYNLKIKVDKSTIQKIHNKLLSYKTLYGYSNNKRFKSFNLKSTFEGYESEYLIKRIKGGN